MERGGRWEEREGAKKIYKNLTVSGDFPQSQPIGLSGGRASPCVTSMAILQYQRA
jgi:hypothetical protein